MAYPVAEARAREWSDVAVLHQIAPVSLMGQNLGIPSLMSGWFFMFQEPGSPVEFYIYVLDGQISGFTEAQAILGEQLPYRYGPIDIDALALDSTDVLAAFLATDRGKSWADAAQVSPIQLDYRLVHLEGQRDPVWTLFSVQGGRLEALIHLNAISGAEVSDPFD